MRRQLISPTLFREFLIPLCAIVSFTAAGAATDDNFTWTSRDGSTIRARIGGWDGSHFILMKGGRDYRVPPSRLTPECEAKARRLLGLTSGAEQPMARTATTPAAAPTSPLTSAEIHIPAVSGRAMMDEIRRVGGISPSVLTRAAQLPMDRLGMPAYGFREANRLVRTTAYACSESDHLVYGCRSAAGTILQYAGTIRSAAADWSRYPVGTVFRIKGLPYLYQVDDYGSALTGTNTIDLYQPDETAMRAWGCRKVEIQVVRWGSLARSERILMGRTGYQHCREMLEDVRRQRAQLAAIAAR